MNPFAQSFIPEPLLSSQSNENLSSIVGALCRALGYEQDAHLETKALLTAEKLHREQLEREVQRLKKSNEIVKDVYERLEKLFGSASSIKQDEIETEDWTKSAPGPSEQETFNSSRDEFRNTTDDTSISTSHYNAKEQDKCLTSSASEGEVEAAPVKDPSQNHDIEYAPGPIPHVSPAPTYQSHEKLIDISDDFISGLNPESNLCDNTFTSHKQHSDTGSVNQWKVRDLLTTENAMLQIPDAFFEKYKYSEENESSDDQSQFDENTNDENTHHLVHQPTNSELYQESISQTEETDRNGHDSNPPSSVQLVQVYEHLELNPQWHIGQNNPIFNDEQEKQMAVRSLTEHPTKMLFYQHPVRYIPEPHETNLYRTIMLDYVPIQAGYRDVLAHVHGGLLESIQIIGPLNPQHQWTTVRIVFQLECGAARMWRHACKQPTLINGTAVRVWQVMEPTYPSPSYPGPTYPNPINPIPMALSDEATGSKNTRLLLIRNIPSGASFVDIREELTQFKTSGYIVVFRVYARELGVEFTSINHAIKAMKTLKRDPRFGFAEFEFQEDPCSGDAQASLEEYTQASRPFPLDVNIETE